jgi:chemotaxis response regulator CheB
MVKTTEKKLRVLVVDDSAFMCKVLKEIINADPQLEVVGQGRDGRDAVALAESLRPDVITMDINMPHVDGLEATELIMSQNPRPIARKFQLLTRRPQCLRATLQPQQSPRKMAASSRWSSSRPQRAGQPP